MGGPAYATALGAQTTENAGGRQGLKPSPMSTPRLNFGLPAHVKAAFFVRRLAENLRSGEGFVAESKWSDVDEHYDGDEALRQVLVSITEATTTFLAEAPAMPPVARLLRLRQIEEEINAYSAALLPAGELSEYSYAVDVVPWAQAVRALMEALQAASNECGTSPELPAWCQASGADRVATPPRVARGESPMAKVREAAAVANVPTGSQFADQVAGSPSGAVPVRGTMPGTADSLGQVSNANVSLHYRGSDLDLASAPLWRTAVTYFLALEACINGADMRRVCRPPPALTSRLPPHCRETVREIGIRVAALVKGASALSGVTAESAEAARTTAAASMWVLLRRLMMQVEAADESFEVDNTGSCGGARAELQAALERAATAAGELLARKAPATSDSMEAAVTAEATGVATSGPTPEEPSLPSAQPGASASANASASVASAGSAQPGASASASVASAGVSSPGRSSSSPVRKCVTRPSRASQGVPETQPKPSKRQGPFQPGERPRRQLVEGGEESQEHAAAAAAGGPSGASTGRGLTRESQAAALPVPLRLPVRSRSGSSPPPHASRSPEAESRKSSLGSATPSKGSSIGQGNLRPVLTAAESAGKDSTGGRGVLTSGARSAPRTPPQSPTPPVRQWPAHENGQPPKAGRPPPPKGPPPVIVPPSKQGEGSSSSPAPAQHRREGGGSGSPAAAQQRRGAEMASESQRGIRRSSGGGSGRVRAVSPSSPVPASSSGNMSPGQAPMSRQASRTGSPQQAKSASKSAAATEAARRAAVEERLAAATGALAEAKGLLCSRLGKQVSSRSMSSMEQARDKNIEHSLVQMVSRIQESLDVAVDAAGKMVSPSVARQFATPEEVIQDRTASRPSQDGRQRDAAQGGQVRDPRRHSPLRGPGRLLAPARPELTAKASVQAPSAAASSREKLRAPRPPTSPVTTMLPEQQQPPPRQQSPQVEHLPRKSAAVRKAVSPGPGQQPQPQISGASSPPGGPARRSSHRPSTAGSGSRSGSHRGGGRNSPA